MKYLLLVFDRRHQRLIDEPLEFLDSSIALRARFSREAIALENHEDLEIEVLGAASREALENTHSRYFGSGRELSLN